MAKQDPADQVALWAERKSPKRKTVGGKRAIANAAKQATEMRESKDWSKAQPRHLVALYAWCHEQVYGVPAEELRGKEWMGAVSAAKKLVREVFDGDVEKAVDFLRWTWAREIRTEKWRRENLEEGGGRRIGWRLQFQRRELITDFRIYRARVAKKGRV